MVAKTWGLGLDTSGAWLGLALAPAEGPVCAQGLSMGRQMSERLLPQLLEFLGDIAPRDLAWVAVVTGPGSFTSLRLGVVVARTLGQQLAIPVFGQSALACAGWGQSRDLAVAMPAHGGRVYGAVAGVEQIFTQEAWTIAAQASPQIRLEDLPPTTVVTILVERSRQAYQAGDRPPWQEVQPNYLQPFPALP